MICLLRFIETVDNEFAYDQCLIVLGELLYKKGVIIANLPSILGLLEFYILK